MYDLPTIANLTKTSAEALIKCVEKMPEDRRTWSPTTDTRNALDMIHEVSESAAWFGEAIRTRSSANLSMAYWMPKLREKAPDIPFEQLASTCQQNCEEFAELLLGVSEEEADVALTGSPWTPTPRELSIFPMRNAWYHMGQINYIQTCYGDFDF